jgi:hypothetical protein
MTTQSISEAATNTPNAATVDLKLEVVVIPVSDVDRAAYIVARERGNTPEEAAQNGALRIDQRAGV